MLFRFHSSDDSSRICETCAFSFDEDAQQLGNPGSFKAGKAVGALERVQIRLTSYPIDHPPKELEYEGAISEHFHEMLKELIAFKLKHNHCNVPSRGWGKLYKWMMRQREKYRTQRLSLREERLLVNVGFSFFRSRTDKGWSEGFDRLSLFHQRHGHINVPQKDPLSLWVQEQLALHEQNQLNEARRERLEALGVVFRDLNQVKLMEAMRAERETHTRMFYLLQNLATTSSGRVSFTAEKPKKRAATIPASVPRAEWSRTYKSLQRNYYTGRKGKKRRKSELLQESCECVAGMSNCGDTTCSNRCLNVECNPQTCPCGSLCENQRFQKRQYPKLQVFQAGKKGYGVLAGEYISAGAFIIEYQGEVISKEQCLQRLQEYDQAGELAAKKSGAKASIHHHFYMLTLSGSEVIDATRKSNLARFINHSCDPNAATALWSVAGENRVGIFAIKDIPYGTEISYDYKFERCSGASKQPCFCGSPICRGYIGSSNRTFLKGRAQDSDVEDIFSDFFMPGD